MPVIGISNVQDTLDLDKLLYLSGLKPSIVEKKRVTAGWTILVGSNGNRSRVGNAVFMRQDTDYIFASFLVAAKPKQDCGLTPEYFFRWLSSEQVQGYLSASSEGTTGLNNLSQSFFRSMAIPVPPPQEQAGITNILHSIDTALESTRATLNRAREVKRALVQRVFSEGLLRQPQKKTRIGVIPESWDVVPLCSVVSNFQYGLSVPMVGVGRMAILRMGNIQDGGVILDDLKFVNLPDKIIEPYVVRRGDVLFNRTNSQEWVGKVGIYRHDAESIFASYLIRLFPDRKKVDNYYLAHVLQSHSTQCRIKRYATPGVQQVNINATNLGKVLIPVPTGNTGMFEQCEIASLLEAADAMIRRFQTVLEAKSVLKKSLMHDLLTGRSRTSTLAEATAA